MNPTPDTRPTPARPIFSVLATLLSGALRLVPYGIRPPNFAPPGALGLYGGARAPLWQALLMTPGAENGCRTGRPRNEIRRDHRIHARQGEDRIGAPGPPQIPDHAAANRPPGRRRPVHRRQRRADRVRSRDAGTGERSLEERPVLRRRHLRALDDEAVEDGLRQPRAVSGWGAGVTPL